MSSNYRAKSASSVVQKARKTRTGRRLERGGYVTINTVVMWLAYVFTLVGNAIIEAGRVGGVGSADIAYDVYTWFTPAGYAFAIWTLIYIALAVWLVDYTRKTPGRPKGLAQTTLLFTASSVLNVLWLLLWHLQQVGASFVVIVAEWIVLAALYLNVRKSAPSSVGWVPISLYAAWVTVATLANMAIFLTRILDGGVAFLNGLSVIVLAAAVLVFGYVMKRSYGDTAFPLVFLWALVAIGVHVSEVSVGLAAVVYLMSIVGAIVTFVPMGRLRSMMATR